MKIYNSITELPNKLAIFPLTGAVLFPQTQLPLNIFEVSKSKLSDTKTVGDGRIVGYFRLIPTQLV